MGRFMAIDYGMKTAGVALSDETGLIASPLETITRDKEGKLRPTLRRIIELAREYDVTDIIVGNPLHMDGSLSERAQKSAEFAALLESRLGREDLGDIRVILYDERLTTREADEILREAGIALTDRKRYIDSIAASLILEDYMHRRNAEKSGSEEEICQTTGS